MMENVGDDRQRDRQEVDRQRQLCVSVVDRQTETHICPDRQVQDQLVATEQNAAVELYVRSWSFFVRPCWCQNVLKLNFILI